MDRVEAYLQKLSKLGAKPCPEGQKIFDEYPPQGNASGLVIRQFFTVTDRYGKFFILQWDIETTTANCYPWIRTSTRPHVQGYHVFDVKARRDAMALIMIDKGIEFRKAG